MEPLDFQFWKLKIVNRTPQICSILLICTGCCFFLCFSVNAQRTVPPVPTQIDSSETDRYIRRIIFHGNNAVEDKILTELLDIKPGQRFDPQLISDALPRILIEYKNIGYMFAKVEWECRPAEKDQVAVYINIREGEIVKMGEIKLSGNIVFSKDELLDKFDTLRSSFFDDSAFQRDMERLLKLYSDNGYPLAKISPSEFRIENGKLNVKIDIDEGLQVKIKQINISGLGKTKEQVVLRELTIHPGDIFDQSEIDESQRRLNNLGYFQGMSQMTFSQAGDDGVILNFSVTEGRTGRFSGILGYNPSEDEVGGQKFTGVLEAAETNLLGTGRQIALSGKFGLIDTYEFAYEEPWVLNTPIDIGIRLWGTEQTDVVSEQSLKEWAASLGGTMRMIRYMEGSLAVAYKQIKSSVETDDLLNGRKYSISIAIQRDSRDYFVNPSAGRLDRISTEVSRGDFKTFKIWLDLNQYFKTWQRQVFAIGLHGARVWGKRIPPTETLYLGGATTLRGYSEDFFRGEGRIFANCEYRFLVSRDSQFFSFLDGGTIYDVDNGLGRFKMGYGVGMRLKSRSGLVNVDYGLARGDSILSGKIHVSLGAMF